MSLHFQFAYPVTFTPVPYHTNTTISRFINELIPLTRTIRHVSVQIPVSNSTGMDVETPVQELQTIETDIGSDGILLYVAQASYEPGTSPLSLWVPIRPYVEWKDKDQDSMDVASTESPLVLFERYFSLFYISLCRHNDYWIFRLLRKRLSQSPGVIGGQSLEIDMN